MGSFPDPEPPFGGFPTVGNSSRTKPSIDINFISDLFNTPTLSRKHVDCGNLINPIPEKSKYQTIYGSSQRLFFVWSFSCTLLFLSRSWGSRKSYPPILQGQSIPLMFDRFLVPFPRPLLLFHFHRQPAWKTPQFFRAENCGVQDCGECWLVLPHFKDLVHRKTAKEIPPWIPAVFLSSWIPIKKSLGSQNLATFGEQRVFFKKTMGLGKRMFSSILLF